MDEESKKLLVVNTPLGLFQYQRLPFGVSSAPAIFQRFLEQLISDIPCCVNYLDDIVVTGKTNEEHIQNLEKLLSKLESAGLRCNKSKCSFMQDKIEYLGNIISKNGIEPSNSGIKAIQELPRPKNLQDVQAFLGKVTYYMKFIKNFSTVAEPLNELRRKDVKFVWGNRQENAFNQLKQQLVDVTTLSHFDENLPLVLATDASSFGVGAVISHIYPDGSERPIAHASKTLNSHQKNYSQIEKEGLAIIYGIKKFHDYLYGRKFMLITDHKPLVSIFSPNKGIPVHSAHRLQRWALFLSSYTFDIKYKATNLHTNADALSRLPCSSDEKFDEELDALEVNFSEEVSSFPISAEKIAECTKKDEVLVKVLKFVKNGWPNHVDEDIKPYFARRQNLTTFNGVIVLQTDYNRVVVPECYRRSVLKLLHEGHWGIVKTKQLARRYCWWPNMDKDIENLIANCTACSMESSMPPKVFSSWQEPTQPWQRIHIDFAGPFHNSYWFICVDSYSHFPYVVKMNSTTTAATISTLKKIFSIEGLPDVIVSDNGPQFVSEEFKKFCKTNNVQHLTTAPFHPASNGQAERFVRTFKTSFKKQINAGKNVENSVLTYLFTYRTTPVKDGKSPSELLHGRQPKTMLSCLLPSTNSNTQITTTNNPQTQTKFNIDEIVIIRNFSRGQRWIKAKVFRKLGNMLYLLKNEDNKTFKRHQNQIRKSSQNQDQNSNTQVDNNDAFNEAQGLLTSIVQSSNNNSFSNSVFPNQTPSTSSNSLTPNQTHSTSSDTVIPIRSPNSRIPIRRSTRTKRPPDHYSPPPFPKLVRRN